MGEERLAVKCVTSTERTTIRGVEDTESGTKTNNSGNGFLAHFDFRM